MTRVTAFGMPKKGNTGSTWEELSGKTTTNEGQAESSGMANKRSGGGGGNAGGEKKRKWGGAGHEEEAGEGGRSGGWGRNEDVKRKAERSENRRVGRIESKHSSTVCFACRQKGHAARECPNVLLAARVEEPLRAEDGENGEAGGKKVKQQGMKRGKGKMGSDVAGSGGRCYRCDSTQHPLSKCPKPASLGLPYASCFICLQTGHLASTCPQNDRGVYPNGGSCKVCGKVDHRASDCPDDKRGKRVVEGEAIDEELKALGDGDGAVVFGIGNGAGADEDDFMVVKRKRVELEKRAAEQRVLDKAAKLAKKIKEKRDFERQTREIAGETGGMTGNPQAEGNREETKTVKQVVAPVASTKVKEVRKESGPAPSTKASPATTTASKPVVAKRPAVARVPKKPKVVVF